LARVEGQERIEDVCEADAQRLHRKPEVAAVAGEGPEGARLLDLEVRLLVTVDQLAACLTVGGLVEDFKRVCAVPLGLDDRDRAGASEACRRSPKSAPSFRLVIIEKCTT